MNDKKDPTTRHGMLVRLMLRPFRISFGIGMRLPEFRFGQMQ